MSKEFWVVFGCCLAIMLFIGAAAAKVVLWQECRTQHSWGYCAYTILR